jgi:hypothetical protein
MKVDESVVCSDKAWQFFKLALLRSETSKTSESSVDE